MNKVPYSCKLIDETCSNLAELFAMLNVDEDSPEAEIIFNTQLTLDITLRSRLEQLRENQTKPKQLK